MARIDDESKRQRKERVHLIVAAGNGLRELEIAQRAGLEPRTTNNYLRELEIEGHLYKDGVLWHALDVKQTKLRSFELSPQEAYTLYLATRLLVKQHDKRNEPAETAMLKLARVLTSDLGVGREIEQAARELAQRDTIPGYQSVFRTMVQGYLYRRRVDLYYRPLGKSAFRTTFDTYLMEPSALGYATYAIGHSSIVGKLRSYKLERIESAQLTQETYQIPADFPGLEVLRHSWSIIMGEETKRVVLRFSPQVRERVKETQWHPSQNDADDAERPGWLRWWVDVADITDMLPWIRGWGADCEVMEPVELRQRLVGEAQRLARLYGVGDASSAQSKYYAHSRPDVDESQWQLLKDHLMATGELAAKLGRAAGISDLARIAGILHDIGKYSAEFQARLRGSSTHVDHATAGAREIVKLFPDPPHRDWAELISYCIAGHHTGLPDYGSKADVETDGTLLARRDKKPLKDFSAYRSEISLPAWQPRPGIKPARFQFRQKELRYAGFSVSFLTRILFSTLVDADWLETERYMDDAETPRGQYASLDVLGDQFNRYLERFADPKTPINRKRTEILNACRAGASTSPGLFTLTVPTGGGKTLASMAFALDHARVHGLERIIYIIPFTSIIEQNAAVFREALGDLGAENVLEHHSNYDWEAKNRASDDETNQAAAKLKLAAENWDIPIVVTTNVQFFESLFASKKSQTRKLHNIAKSVLVFDEAQMLPRHYLKPCLLAMQELVQNYGCSAVLCTATQPSLQRFFPGQTRFTELAPDPQALFDFFRRVQVTSLETVPDAELIKKLHAQQQVLCIVNTRRHAKGLFDLMESDGTFHLSTLMCPAHRKATLDEVRRRLKSGETCRLVSTQVMEAGIDVDFSVGFRALAGLDSIIQAAGRINREMRSVSGDVFVFRPQTEFIKRTPEFIKQTGSVAETVLRDHADDPTTLAAIEAYYTLLYNLHDERAFDARGILEHFEKGTGRSDFDFRTAAEKFKLIDESSVTVFIPYNEEARQRIEALTYATFPTRILRQLQSYAVNIYEYEFQNLQNQGAIQTINDTYHVLDRKWMDNLYNSATGLVIPERSSGVAIFVD